MQRVVYPFSAGFHQKAYRSVVGLAWTEDRVSLQLQAHDFSRGYLTQHVRLSPHLPVVQPLVRRVHPE